MPRVLAIAVLSASISAGLGIWQSLHGVARADARFGNYGYFGQYLVPHVLFCAWLGWRHRGIAARLLWTALGLVLLGGVLVSRSRGAMVGLVAVPLLTMVVCGVKDRRFRRRAIMLLVAMPLAIAGYLAANAYQPTEKLLTENRLSIRYLKNDILVPDGSARARSALYGVAWTGITQRPLLGWGPENFASVFYRYNDAEKARGSMFETMGADRAHCFAIDLLVNVGVLGFVSFLAMILLAFRGALTAPRAQRPGAVLLLIACGAHLVTSLFSFETPVSYVVLFLELAALSTFAARGSESRMAEVRMPVAFPVAGLTALAAVLLCRYAVINEARGERALSAIGDATSPDAIAANVEKLISLESPNREHYLIYAGGLPEGEAAVAALANAADVLEGDYAANYAIAIELWRLESRTPDQTKAMMACLERAKALAPERPDVRWLYAAMHDEEGDDDRLLTAYRGAAQLQLRAGTRGQLVAALLERGRFDDAVQIVAATPKESRQDPDFVRPIFVVLEALIRSEEFEAMSQLYDASVEIGDRSVWWQLCGFLGARGRGDPETAQTIADEGRQWFPATVFDGGALPSVI
jgi:hypothetical protein